MDDREDRNVTDEDRTLTDLEVPVHVEDSTTDEAAILDEVKIEEVGIDGMCGVY
jgi:mycofactocin precursor